MKGISLLDSNPWFYGIKPAQGGTMALETGLMPKAREFMPIRFSNAIRHVSFMVDKEKCCKSYQGG